MENEKYKKYLPHLWVFAGFCTFLLIAFMIIDSFILPSMILNEDKVEVPDVTGMKFEDAEMKLDEAGLKFRKSASQYNEEYPENHVINQNPKPNMIVKCGRHINLTISKGGESVTMPNIINKPLRFARVALMQRGLYIGNIEYVFSDLKGADTVISQNKTPGRKITFGSYVSLIVSKGLEAEIEVPNLTGKTLAEVESILEKYNLQLGNISNTYEELYAATYMRNTVVDQFPQTGEIVIKNTKIDITMFR
ncbi:PASTA domain-containing protein [Bacteroidota bacterium]